MVPGPWCSAKLSPAVTREEVRLQRFLVSLPVLDRVGVSISSVSVRTMFSLIGVAVKQASKQEFESPAHDHRKLEVV